MVSDEPSEAVVSPSSISCRNHYHCAWLYFRFRLRYRDGEEIMAERGAVVTHEAIRDWSHKFGGNLRQEIAIAGGASWRSLASR
jgi:transposase-like protein